MLGFGFGLVNATGEYVVLLAVEGIKALQHVPALRKGVNVIKGKIVHEQVAQAHGVDYTPLDEVLPLAV